MAAVLTHVQNSLCRRRRDNPRWDCPICDRSENPRSADAPEPPLTFSCPAPRCKRRGDGFCSLQIARFDDLRRMARESVVRIVVMASLLVVAEQNDHHKHERRLRQALNRVQFRWKLPPAAAVARRIPDFSQARPESESAANTFSMHLDTVQIRGASCEQKQRAERNQQNGHHQGCFACWRSSWGIADLHTWYYARKTKIVQVVAI